MVRATWENNLKTKNKSMKLKSVTFLNKMASRVHKLNKKWWRDIDTGKPIKRRPGELAMLIITELSEAMEGVRKDLMDDHLPHRKMEEVEMADAIIRLFDFAGGFNIKFSNNVWVPAFPFNGTKAECLLSLCATAIPLRDLETNYVSILAISIQNYCIRFNLDLWGAVKDKLKYNKTRKDHTHAARRSKNGKKF
jgi:hypothetical protein